MTAMDRWWLRSCPKPTSTSNPLIDNPWNFCCSNNGNAAQIQAYEYDNSWYGSWTKDGDSTFGDGIMVDKICWQIRYRSSCIFKKWRC